MTSNLISKKRVPNIIVTNQKILFIAESPGDEETKHGIPLYPSQEKFQNAGKLFTNIIERNKIPRDSVSICNLSQFQPYHNDFNLLRESDELKSGIADIEDAIKRNPPTVIVPLGNEPLRYMVNRKGIWNWRGSILQRDGIKVIPTFHPSYVNRDRTQYPIFDVDIKRIYNDSAFPELRLPEREAILLNGESEKLDEYVRELLQASYLSVDIETFGPELACVGFSDGIKRGICIFSDGTMAARNAISQLLSSQVPKILHFATFDSTFLNYREYVINNIYWCTYQAQRVLDPELPRTLAYLTSEHTREPYYKPELKDAMGDIKSWSRKTGLDKLGRYNCKDTPCTLEIFLKQKPSVEDDKDHKKVFFYDMELLEVARSISLQGMLVDKERRAVLRKALYDDWVINQSQLNKLNGLNEVTLPLLEALVLEKKGTKRYKLIQQLAGINCNSSKQIRHWLYEVLLLPKAYKKDAKTDELKETADEAALIKLLATTKNEIEKYKSEDKRIEWTKKHLTVKIILIIRGIRKKISSYIEFGISDDGRVRSIYKLAAETGRWANEAFLDGTGFNHQTMPRDKVKIA